MIIKYFTQGNRPERGQAENLLAKDRRGKETKVSLDHNFWALLVVLGTKQCDDTLNYHSPIYIEARIGPA